MGIVVHSTGANNPNLKRYVNAPEICEDALNDRAYFEKAFGLAADLCRRMMKNYPSIRLENVVSHKEAHSRGYASNHGVPENWLVRFGKDMDWFRDLVAGERQVKLTAEISVAQSKADEVSKKLKALGCSVKAE